jgi:hypothetical protein
MWEEMMLKRLTVAVTTIGSLGLVLVLSLAGSAPAITTATTLRLTVDPEHVRERFVDVAPVNRFNPGDVFLVRERLLDDDGAVAGFDQIMCTAHIPSVVNEETGQFRVSQLCEGTFTLPDGTIEVSGTVSFFGEGDVERAAAPFSTARRERTQGFFVAVTGGTGEYQNARGEVQVRGATLSLVLIP